MGNQSNTRAADDGSSTSDRLTDRQGVGARDEETANGSMTREERVRRAAYALAEQRGFAPGFETEDWLEAEKQVALQTDA